MKEKLALIVDDSRSARLVLQRMLEKHGLKAHTVASAEEALDYLLRHRPDVIFMDHMMPGMDGFDAIRQIKKNLETATIPIIMFTSQSGELYLSQARALGAVDILPKATAAADLEETLRRLGLLPKTVEPVAAPAAAAEEKSVARSLRRFTSELLRPSRPPADDLLTELREIRRYLSDQSETLHQNLQASLRLYSGRLNKSLSDRISEEIRLLRQSLPQPERRSEWPVVLLVLLLCLSLFWNYRLQQTLNERPATPAAQTDARLQARMEKLEWGDTVAEETEQGAVSTHDWSLAEWAVNQNMQFPYDELALGRQRLPAIRQLLKMAEAAGFRGRILLQTHVGEFCLQGNTGEGYRLAAANLPIDKCDEIMNPAQAEDRVALQQSVEFANFLATAANAYEGIHLELGSLPREQALYEYPPRTGNVTAGQWNRVAQLNNRIMVSLIAEE
ncbi:MAG TPA: response regulator [Gammaproteobacteria bacterium]|nr:response regulator [Gammaproteobacteria bacterium]